MNVLVLGSGGREHSICSSLRKSKKLSKIWCIPGNAGIKKLANCTQINLNDNKNIIDFCIKKNIDLVIPGSEEYLARGVCDDLRLYNIKVFGPSKESSLLETSKIFTKQVCKLGSIRTSKWQIIDNYKEAKTKLKSFKFPLVIKLDKLAAGKGVLVAHNYKEAKSFLDKIDHGKIGKKDSRIIVEKKLVGKEASFFFVVDGKTAKFLGSAQDYKRVGEKNTGLNTGGMGCISPSPFENKENIDLVKKQFIEPTIKVMNTLGYPFNGILYAGLMFTKSGIHLIEYNVRLGDPECQALMLRLKNSFLDICIATNKKKLNKIKINLDNMTSICIVLASKGYPESYKSGYIIKGLKKIKDKNATVYHAGTKLSKNKDIITNGGRVLNLVVKENSLHKAKIKAYDLIKNINSSNLFYRKDIGD